MDSINTMLIIDIVIIVLGVYLLFISLRMKKTKKVEKIMIAEEVLRNCKAEDELAKILSRHLLICSTVMIICGAIMAVHESFFNLGYWYYPVVGVLVVAVIIFYKQLTDARIKYC